jgi:hypothetical protein
MTINHTVWRRGATLERLERTPVFNRRSATASAAGDFREEKTVFHNLV